MKYVKVVLVVGLMLAAVVVNAESDVNLSAKITSTRPLRGTCAPLHPPAWVVGEVGICQLPRMTWGWCQFSGKPVRGYFVAGEVVGYAVVRITATERYCRITRAMRCGNPSGGEFVVFRSAPVVEVRTEEVLRRLCDTVTVDLPPEQVVVHEPTEVEHEKIVLTPGATTFRDLPPEQVTIHDTVEVEHDRVVLAPGKTDFRDLPPEQVVVHEPTEVEHEKIVLTPGATIYRDLQPRVVIVDRPVFIGGGCYIPPPSIIPNDFAASRPLNRGWEVTSRRDIATGGIGYLGSRSCRTERTCPPDSPPPPDPPVD